MDDQVIKLVFQADTSGVGPVRAGLAEVRKAGADAGAALQKLADDTRQAMATVGQVVETADHDLYDLADGAMAAARKAGTATYDMAEGFEQVADAETHVTTSARAMGAAVEQGARSTTAAATQARAASANFNGMNSTIRNLGFGVSDVFSNNGPLGQKIGGFANNVGNITTGILGMMGKTGPAALAAAAGLEIAFTGVGAALTALGIKSVGDLFGGLGGATETIRSNMEKLQESIKDLESKPHLIPVEVQQLEAARQEVDRIKAGLEAVEKLRKSQAYYEKQSGSQVQEAFTEGEGGAAAIEDKTIAALTAKMMSESGGLADAQKRQAAAEAEAERFAAMPASPASMNEEAKQRDLAEAARDEAAAIRLAIRQAATAEFGAVYNEATTGAGPVQRAGQTKLAGLLRASGQGDVAGGIEGASPEAIQAEEAADSEFEQGLEDRKNAVKARNEREKQAKADAKAKAAAGKKAVAADEKDENAGSLMAKIQQLMENTGAGLDEQANVLAGLVNAPTKKIREELTRRKNEARDDADARKVVEDAQAKHTKEAAQGIVKAGGDTYAKQYERALAANSAANQEGGGVNPQKLRRQMQDQMARKFAAEGHSNDASRQAATAIAGKGEQGFQQHMTQAVAGGLNVNQAALFVATKLDHEIQAVNGQVAKLQAEWAKLGARSRTNQRRGRN